MITVTFFGVPVKTCSPKVPAWDRVARHVEELLQRRLGREVEITYVDLFSPAALQYGSVVEQIQRSDLPIPVLTLGDEILHAGAPVPVSQIARRLETLLPRAPADTPANAAGGAQSVEGSAP